MGRYSLFECVGGVAEFKAVDVVMVTEVSRYPDLVAGEYVWGGQLGDAGGKGLSRVLYLVHQVLTRHRAQVKCCG